MDTKICSRCGEAKPLSEFYSMRGKRKGLRADCKECVRVRNKDYYAKTIDKYHEKRATFRAENRDLLNRRERESYARLRTLILDTYGRRCACCGEDEPLFLELDHVDNDGAQHRRMIGSSAKQLYTEVKRQGFPKGKYQLLCANCNQGKKRGGGICPHKSKSDP